MHYNLIFDRKQLALGFAVPRDACQTICDFRPDTSPGITAYIGRKPSWQTGQKGRIGYDGCAELRKNGEYIEVLASLTKNRVKSILLTLGFLIDHLNGRRFEGGVSSQ